MSDIRLTGERLFNRVAATLKLRPATLKLLLVLLLVGACASQIQDFIRGFFHGLSQ